MWAVFSRSCFTKRDKAGRLSWTTQVKAARPGGCSSAAHARPTTEHFAAPCSVDPEVTMPIWPGRRNAWFQQAKEILNAHLDDSGSRRRCRGSGECGYRPFRL